MSTVPYRLRTKSEQISAHKSVDEGTDMSTILLPLKYRILYYVCGLLFAVFSYIAGVLVFSPEPITSGPEFFSIFPAHNFDAHVVLFIAWAVICVSVSIIAGTMFQREYTSRIQAERLANTDGLTGLYNHAYFQKRLEEEINRAARHGRGLSLIMLDLDNFKPFNDTWGHQEGDRLLEWFSEVLQTSIRDHDIISRYGGEEFVVLLPETEVKDALLVAQRIVDSTSRLSATSIGKDKQVTVSAGVSTFPAHGTTKYMLIMSADTALYRAKLDGKNRAVEYIMNGVRRTTLKDKQSGIHDDSNDNSEALRYLAAIVDGRSGYNEQHSENIERYSLLLGKAVGLSIDELEHLRTVAILHDMGSICIPEAILTKTEPLSDTDWTVIREHVQVGAAMLSRVGQNEFIAPSVRHHHEHYDGSGYPDGFSGNDIPLFARIIAIADAFTSMTSPRPYRKPMSNRRALNEIQRCSGTQFDPELATAFIDIVTTPRRKKAA